MVEVSTELAKLGYGLGAEEGEAFWLLGISKRSRSVERTLPGSSAWSRSLFLRASARPGTSIPKKTSGSTS
jgi:hypothetical protein